jgi:hypothetical protein
MKGVFGTMKGVFVPSMGVFGTLKGIFVPGMSVCVPMKTILVPMKGIPLLMKGIFGTMRGVFVTMRSFVDITTIGGAIHSVLSSSSNNAPYANRNWLMELRAKFASMAC